MHEGCCCSRKSRIPALLLLLLLVLMPAPLLAAALMLSLAGPVSSFVTCCLLGWLQLAVLGWPAAVAMCWAGCCLSLTFSVKSFLRWLSSQTCLRPWIVQAKRKEKHAKAWQERKSHQQEAQEKRQQK